MFRQIMFRLNTVDRSFFSRVSHVHRLIGSTLSGTQSEGRPSLVHTLIVIDGGLGDTLSLLRRSRPCSPLVEIAAEIFFSDNDTTFIASHPLRTCLPPDPRQSRPSFDILGRLFSPPFAISPSVPSSFSFASHHLVYPAFSSVRSRYLFCLTKFVAFDLLFLLPTTTIDSR